MNTYIIHIVQRTLTVMVAMPFAFQLWGFFVCNRYKNAATNINTTNREIFRSIRLRYTNSAKLNIPLADNDSFIAKYFYGKGGPFRFVTGLERVSAIFVCISLLGTTALYIRGYADTTRMVAIISATICYYVFRMALSTGRQMELTLSFTKDYLDNTLKHRIAPEPMRHTKSDAPATPAVEKVALNTLNNNISANTDTSVDKEVINENVTDENIINDNIINKNIMIKKAAANDSSDIIEAVLREFLA